MDVPGQFISRVAARRADFRYALRLGDAAGAARAASRLLVVANALDPATGHRIRDARIRLGHGLRLARQRRAIGPILIPSISVGAAVGRPRQSTNRKWALVAALGAIALLLIMLVPAPRAATTDEGGGGGVAVAPDQIAANLTLRGRTSDIATPPPVAVVTPPPDETPAPTAEPAVVAPVPARTGTPGGSGTGGS